MKRSTASTSLNLDVKQCDNINAGQVLNETCKYDNNKENKLVTFSDQDSDESMMKPPLQSTSSGYYSLDETEGDLWRSDTSNDKYVSTFLLMKKISSGKIFGAFYGAKVG